MLRYVKFGTLNLFLIFNIITLLLGGWWLWISCATLLLISSPADEIVGDDLAKPSHAPERLLLSLLFLSLPLLATNSFIFMHYFGSTDFFHFVRGLKTIGIDLETAKNSTNFVQLLGGIVVIGLYIGSAGTNVAHELVHRTSSMWSQWIGRWLLAFSFDTTFSIEHVHGHHRHVATDKDPATAKRGQNVFSFAINSLIFGNISGFKIEAERLKRRGFNTCSWRNKAITGQFMSLFILTVAWLVGGVTGLVACIICGIQGKFYLEIINYIEHYGLVRVPGGRVEARHSWNCYRSISGAILYNLPRHSHHHSFAAKPFWDLEVDEQGPVLPYGYLTMIFMALIPPLFKRRMQPLLIDWDKNYANDAERQILAKSGVLTSALLAAE